MRCIACVGFVACGSSHPVTPPAITPPTAPPTGVIEGHVTDSKTGAMLAGIEIDVGSRNRDREVVATTTDEHGHYRLELAPCSCELFASYPGATTELVPVDVHEHQTTKFDVTFDHDALDAALDNNPPLSCPGSARNAIVEGHTTSQADLDAVASAVLARFAADRGTMPDAGLMPSGPALVATDIGGRRNRFLSRRALPAGSPEHFIAKTRAEIQAEANQSNRKITFIEFAVVDSDGSCAIVWDGVNFVKPSNQSQDKLCCCTGVDVYEKRGGRWTFVRRASEMCS